MLTKKEGRGRTTPNEMPSKIGRLMFHDLMKFGTSGYSPFLEKSYLSKKFYTSRPEFQEIDFGSFQNHARRVAAQVLAVMTDTEKTAEQARLTSITKKEKASTPTDASNENASRSSPQTGNSSRVKSLRDTIVAPYPNGEMAIVIFECDGDIDGRAFELQFSNNGEQIAVRSRVPVELTNAELLLGGKKTSRKPIQDADSMLLSQVIKQRLHGCETSDDGNLWELREIISLPFPCKKNLYNRIGNEIPNYLLRENKKGYAWGYFWVVAEHVGQKNEGPRPIRCKASSDDESDDDESQMDSCDDELENMSVQYESMSNDEVDTSIEEIERNLQHKEKELSHENPSELNLLNERCVLLQHCLENKDLEIAQMKQFMNETTQKLADYDSLKENIGKTQQNLESKNVEYAKLQQVLDDSLVDFNLLQENFRNTQQSLESKNGQIVQLQHILHEKNQTQEQHNHELHRLNERINELEEWNQEKAKDCVVLTDKIKILNQTLDCKNAELLTLETRLKKEKEQRAADKKAINAANIKSKEQSQKMKKMETELKKAMETKKKYEMDLQDKQQNIQQLESTAQKMQTEVETRQLRLEELQLVVNWKDEQYKKIQLDLQEKIGHLQSQRKNQAAEFHQEIRNLTKEIQDLKSQQIQSNSSSLMDHKNEVSQKSASIEVDDDKNLSDFHRMGPKPTESTQNKKLAAAETNVNEQGNESPTIIAGGVEKSCDASFDKEASEQSHNVHISGIEKQKIFGTNPFDSINETMHQNDTKATSEQEVLPVQRKLSIRKQKKLPKKRQKSKTKMNSWKERVAEAVKHKSSVCSTHCTDSPPDADDLNEIDSDQKEAMAKKDDSPSKQTSEETIGWDFDDDDIVIESGRDNTRDEEVCDTRETCDDFTEPDSSYKEANNRKRNSSVFEPLEESEHAPPMKKIRKSRRLAEKRLAKAKID